MRVAVVMGGINSEREISLRSGEAILKSLQKEGYDAFKIDLTEDNLVSAFTENEYDVAFLALHGAHGEDGRVQGLLDMLGKKYTGSGVEGSAVAMNKILTKIIADDLGIRVAKTFKTLESIDRFPVVIKPSKEGSSVGLYICNTIDEAKKACEELKETEFLIEEFVSGEEITSGILNGEELGVLKIKPKSGVYDYESKYTKGKTEYEYPAKIDENLYNEISKTAKKIHDTLNLKGASRSDFILKDDKFYFLEVNTCPGMTETSLVPKLASLKNYSFDDLVKKILENV